MTDMREREIVLPVFAAWLGQNPAPLFARAHSANLQGDLLVSG